LRSAGSDAQTCPLATFDELVAEASAQPVERRNLARLGAKVVPVDDECDG
jgi:hypothetical protein